MSSKDAGAQGTDKQLLVESLAIMAISSVLFAVTFTFDRVPAIFAQGIQPTVFPRAILLIMFGLAALQAVKATRLSPAEFAKLSPHKPIPRIVYLTALSLIAFFLAMPVIGTFPTLIIFCPLLAFLWGEKRWGLLVPSFAGFIAFIYVLFRMILNIPLP